MDTLTETCACPHCGTVLGGPSHPLGERPLIGEVLDCGGCGAPLEVAGLRPLQLVPFAKIEEDEEDFD